MNPPQRVYLVGAGPGDPGLLTLRGRDCLKKADVVIYDKLANPALLELAPSDARRIYVGKQAANHTVPQYEINALLIREARANACVVRLKGGDPYVFGRGGEEALALQQAGIAFEIIPGVTAATAAAAYAGIPVTHRHCSSMLTLITGHENPDKPNSAIDWATLARGGGTLAFYMGIRNLPRITENLIRHGMVADTPVALIANGTHPDQKTITGTLRTIGGLAKQAEIRPPAMIIVGAVVQFRDRLHWFEDRPLFGRTVVVTRARTQASELAARLEALGANVLLFPTIRIEPTPDPAPLQAAIARIREFDWILFTSVNGVDAFFSALKINVGDARSLSGCRIAAIGSATATRLRDNGIRADLIPPHFTSRSLFTTLCEKENLHGKKILLPRADIAPFDLLDWLVGQGAEVTAVDAYSTRPGEPDDGVFDALAENHIDVVTFTSSSTAINFARMIQQRVDSLPQNVLYAAIGPETARTACTAGLTIDIEAKEHTIKGLIQAICHYFEEQT